MIEGAILEHKHEDMLDAQGSGAPFAERTHQQTARAVPRHAYQFSCPRPEETNGLGDVRERLADEVRHPIPTFADPIGHPVPGLANPVRNPIPGVAQPSSDAIPETVPMAVVPI